MAVVAKYVAIGEEVSTTYGTAVAAAKYIDVPRANPKEMVKWVDQEGISSSSLTSSEIGEKGAHIDWDMYVRYDDGIGWILKWLLGPATSAQQAATAAYSHTYTAGDTIRSFTVLVGTEDLTQRTYPGQVIKSVEFSSTPGGYLMVKVFTYGKARSATAALGTPSFATVVPAMHSDLVFKVDTVAKTAFLGATSVSITNNVRESALAAGSNQPQSKPRHTKRRVTWSAELVDYDAALTTAYDAGTKVALEWAWTGATIADTYKYGLTINLGEAAVDDYDKPVQGREIETHKYGGFAEYKATDTEIKVTLMNTDTAYADAS